LPRPRAFGNGDNKRPEYAPGSPEAIARGCTWWPALSQQSGGVPQRRGPISECDPNCPMHGCIANYRVSAFFYRYRRDVLGMNEAEAGAEMEQVWHPEGVWAAFVGRQC
jgi:hypothetical protein